MGLKRVRHRFTIFVATIVLILSLKSLGDLFGFQKSEIAKPLLSSSPAKNLTNAPDDSWFHDDVPSRKEGDQTVAEADLANNITTFGQLFKDLDLKQQPLCGGWKCLFGSKSDPTVAWFIAMNKPAPKRNGMKPPKASETWDKGWTLANSLQAKYGIRHFLLEPPILVDSKSEREYVSTLASILPRATDRSKFKMGEYVAQKVRLAPPIRVELKCDRNKYLPELIDLVRDNDRRTTNISQAEFARQFHSGMNVAIKILHDMPAFAEDFQLLVDSSGFVHHIDLDRVYMFPYNFVDEQRKKRMVEKAHNMCIPILQEFSRAIDVMLVPSPLGDQTAAGRTNQTNKTEHVQ